MKKNKLLLQWLYKTNFFHLMGRISENIPMDIVHAKFSTSFSSTRTTPMIHLGSYNYAGLNGHPYILAEAAKALQKYGTSTSGVRLLNGTCKLHLQFEQKLGCFLERDNIVTYSSGYIANTSVLPALCDKNDTIFSDAYNHQSIIDGIKLSGANVIKYPHADYNALECALSKTSFNTKKFIVCDGIFSMEGDTGDLSTIVRLAKTYNAFTIVDDAHAIGALGSHGQGTAHHFNVQNDIDIIIGSLSKGLPGIGGFAACKDKAVADLLRYGSNGYIFSASLPPTVLGGLIASINILQQEPQRQIKLKENSEQLRQGLKIIGFDTMKSCTAVIPVLLKDRKKTYQFAEMLHRKGVFVNPISFPAVPLYGARLRLNASTALSNQQLVKALSIMKETGEELGIC